MAMVTAQTYQQVVLEDPEGHWELHRGRLREKPSMSFRHNDVCAELGFVLRRQLDRDIYRVRVNAGRVSRSDETYYIPDVAVIPLALAEPFRDRPDVLEVYTEPLPLVVEVWSPSTGGYDVDAKLPEYQRRGDAEIWRLHPFDRTLAVWRRQPNGSYAKETYQGGLIRPAALPGVTIDLDAVWAR
jgi:Uma2 family endonuclease